MLYVTRKEHFNAAHKLANPNWDAAKNEEVFGKCANENWHGHNYNLYVTVKGEPDPETGFIINVKNLSMLIKEKVLDKCDHKNVNMDVDFMDGIQPSTENFVKAIWDELEPSISGCTLHEVKLYETETIFAQYFG